MKLTVKFEVNQTSTFALFDFESSYWVKTIQKPLAPANY